MAVKQKPTLEVAVSIVYLGPQVFEGSRNTKAIHVQITRNDQVIDEQLQVKAIQAVKKAKQSVAKKLHTAGVKRIVLVSFNGLGCQDEVIRQKFIEILGAARRDLLLEDPPTSREHSSRSYTVKSARRRNGLQLDEMIPKICSTTALGIFSETPYQTAQALTHNENPAISI